nr:response regulator [Actinomycetota bacterium]
MQRILLVEDHASFRQTLAFVFDRESEFEVVAQAGSLAEARQVIDGLEVDLGVMDLSLPD